MKSFIGRLSRDGTLVADQISGEISELRTDTLREWHGKLNLPIALRKLPYESSPLRLDCNDGFAIMITLGVRHGEQRWPRDRGGVDQHWSAPELGRHAVSLSCSCNMCSRTR